MSGNYIRTMKNYRPVPGEHCESSAIVNALKYQLYTISEEQIIGAGAAPGFVYEKSGFPFLGGRSHTMRECFSETCRIPYKIKEKSTPSDLSDLESLINREIPVVLRVDMRYLPYLFKGKFGPSYMSFGWHYVTLFELDKTNEIARVSDTSFSELQNIKLPALEKARFSRTKIYPPNGEYYYFQKADGNFSLDWSEIAELSLKQYFHNMNHESVLSYQLKGLSGLSQLSKEILNLPKQVPPFLVSSVLDFHYGCIETNGTGGAAFRTMYYRFLEKHLYSKNREAILAAAKECEQSWHYLAVTYKEGASVYKKGSKERRVDVLMNISNKVEKVYSVEYEMNKLIKETLEL